MDLKVDNPEKYGFNPKELLSTIMDVYIHLVSDEFCSSIAREGRSYKKELFEKSFGILRKHGLKPEEDVQKLEQMIQRVEKFKLELEQEDVEIEDAPDEFLGLNFKEKKEKKKKKQKKEQKKKKRKKEKKKRRKKKMNKVKNKERKQTIFKVSVARKRYDWHYLSNTCPF